MRLKCRFSGLGLPRRPGGTKHWGDATKETSAAVPVRAPRVHKFGGPMRGSAIEASQVPSTVGLKPTTRRLAVSQKVSFETWTA
jgi:hypothetical protein